MRGGWSGCGMHTARWLFREKRKEALSPLLPPPHLVWVPSQSCLSIQLRSRPRVC